MIICWVTTTDRPLAMMALETVDATARSSGASRLVCNVISCVVSEAFVIVVWTCTVACADVVGHDEPDVPVNARAGIPPRRRLGGIICAHAQHVSLVAKIQMAGQVIAKARVAGRALAQMKAIDPDIAVGHHAVEVDENTLAGVLPAKREGLAIPTHPRRQ
jgi:hypothetical protein